MNREAPGSLSESSYLHEISQTGDETIEVRHRPRAKTIQRREEELPWLPPPIWKTTLWFLFDTVMILISPFILIPFCYLMSGLDPKVFDSVGSLMTGWIAVAYVLLHHFMDNRRFTSALIKLRWNTPLLILVFTPVVMFMAVIGAYVEYYLIYFFTGKKGVAHGLLSWHEVAYFGTITFDSSVFSGNLFGVDTDPAYKAILRYVASWALWVLFATDTQGGHGLSNNANGDKYYNQWGAIFQAFINTFFITYTIAAPILKRFIDPNISVGNRAGLLTPYYLIFTILQYGLCYAITEMILHIENIPGLPSDFDEKNGLGHAARTHGTWMTLSYVLLAVCQMWYRLTPHINPKGSVVYVFGLFALWFVLMFGLGIAYLAYYDYVVWPVVFEGLKITETVHASQTLRPSFTFSFSSLGMVLLWQAMTHYSRKANDAKTGFM